MPTSLPTYTGDISQLVPQSGVRLADALIGGSKWGTGGAGTAAALTFAFPLTVAAFDTTPGVAGNYADSAFSSLIQGFTPFDAAEQQAARAVLQAWGTVANVSFAEVAADSVSAGVLRFANTTPLTADNANLYGKSWIPQDFAGAGDTWMNASYLFPEGWAPGTQNFLTLLHEVGHALGLKHPHDVGFGPAFGFPIAEPVVLPKTGASTLIDESTETMVMAYNDIPNVDSLGGLSLLADFAPTTPMRWDIAATQYLYGANMAYNAGDNVYTFDGAARYNQTLWDAGGNDSIVATGNRDVEIDLRPGSWSKLGLPLTYSTRNPDLSVAAAQPQLTNPATVFIYDTVTIENATGGGGNDRITGNSVANALVGGAGNDTILGLEGNDTISGGDGNDLIAGGAGNDQLDGGAGYDAVDYRGDVALNLNFATGVATLGSDTDTLAGFEAVFGSSAADTVQGREGDVSTRGETVRGGGGNDTIDGGGGVDTAEFTGPRAGYSISRDLATGVITVTDIDPSNGDEGSDQLVNIERLVFADQLLAFGQRAEDIARVAAVLWSPAIFSIPAFSTLFARGYSFYDVGYSFEFMSSVALQFWTQLSDTELAAQLVTNSHTSKSAAQLLAIDTAQGGGDAGRSAMVREAANDPGVLATIDASNVKLTGIVADLVVKDFGVLFQLTPG